MAYMTEEELEMMSLEWFKEIGYSFVHGPDLAPDAKSTVRLNTCFSFLQTTLTLSRRPGRANNLIHTLFIF